MIICQVDWMKDDLIKKVFLLNIHRTLMHRTKRWWIDSLVVLFSCCRRPVVCRSASSSSSLPFFLLSSSSSLFSWGEREREKDEEAQAVRLNASSLVSKQHNAYNIHIQRYKTIANNADRKKKKNEILKQHKIDRERKDVFASLRNDRTKCRSSLADSVVLHH